MWHVELGKQIYHHTVVDGMDNVTVLMLVILHSIRIVHAFNTLRPRQDGRQFEDYIFKYIFFQRKCLNATKVSLKFVPNGSIDNMPAMVRSMAWCQTGYKSLPEPMLTQFSEPYMRLLVSVG